MSWLESEAEAAEARAEHAEAEHTLSPTLGKNNCVRKRRLPQLL